MTDQLGKIPPQDIELEKAVLGSIILEQEAFLKVSDILSPFDFYNENHVKIFDCITNLFSLNVPIDLLTITDSLRKSGELEAVGGAYYLSTLTQNIASAANIEQHALFLSELSMRRTLIQEAAKLVNDGFDNTNDFDAVLEKSVTLVDRIIQRTQSKRVIYNIQQGLQHFVDEVQNIQKNLDKEVKKGWRTRINELAEIVPEYKPTNLIITAGRPSMGKTAFVLSEVVDGIKSGERILFFSLEMSVYELISRVIQRETDLTQYNFENRLGAYEWESIDNAIIQLQDKGLFIDDTPGVSFAHIKAKTKILKKTQNITGIVIDYLQLMSTDRKLPREQQIAMISQQCKGLAKEFEIPVILIAQLNREADKRPGNKPMLSDLRESGSIEQDADVVIFPFRPFYYAKDEEDLKNKGVLIVAKNRGGKTGEAETTINNTVTLWGENRDTIESKSDHFNPSVFSEPKSDLPY